MGEYAEKPFAPGVHAKMDKQGMVYLMRLVRAVYGLLLSLTADVAVFVTDHTE